MVSGPRSFLRVYPGQACGQRTGLPHGDFLAEVKIERIDDVSLWKRSGKSVITTKTKSFIKKTVESTRNCEYLL